jgi:hypothetical protein
MKTIVSILVFCLFLITFASKLELEHTPSGNLEIEKKGQYCWIDCHKVSGHAPTDKFTFSRVNIPLSAIMFNDVCQGIGRSCACKTGKKFFRSYLGG